MSTHASGANGAPPPAQERRLPDQSIARALGALSLGLGAPQLGMPGRFARLIGGRPGGRSRALTRFVGVREIVAGTGLLSRPHPVGWLWARVGGDAFDLALLGAALASRRAQRRGRLAGAAGAVVGIAALDVLAALRMSRTATPEHEGVRRHVRAAITVWKPREEVYGFWHDLERLPQFMAHLESVERQGEGRSHWKAAGPAGRTVEWDAEVVEERQNELIAWRSVDGSQIEHAGSVRFAPAPGDWGTEVVVDLTYAPPAGAVGATVAQLFGEEPRQQVEDDLRRFKQVMEAGEIVRSEGSPEGTRARRQLLQRRAQPQPANANGGEAS